MENKHQDYAKPTTQQKKPKKDTKRVNYKTQRKSINPAAAPGVCTCIRLNTQEPEHRRIYIVKAAGIPASSDALARARAAVRSIRCKQCGRTGWTIYCRWIYCPAVSRAGHIETRMTCGDAVRVGPAYQRWMARFVGACGIPDEVKTLTDLIAVKISPRIAAASYSLSSASASASLAPATVLPPRRPELSKSKQMRRVYGGRRRRHDAATGHNTTELSRAAYGASPPALQIKAAKTRVRQDEAPQLGVEARRAGATPR